MMEREIRNLLTLIRRTSHVEHDNMLILHSLTESINKNHPDNHELIMQADEHRRLVDEAAETIEQYTRTLLRLVGIE